MCTLKNKGVDVPNVVICMVYLKFGFRIVSVRDSFKINEMLRQGKEKEAPIQTN